MPGNKITWSKESVQQMASAVSYIRRDSMQNADAVHNRMLERIFSAADNPGMFPPDSSKINNDGKFRAFIIDNYKVSYRVTKDGIRILRVRHTKMKPKNY